MDDGVAGEIFFRTRMSRATALILMVLVGGVLVAEGGGKSFGHVWPRLLVIAGAGGALFHMRRRGWTPFAGHLLIAVAFVDFQLISWAKGGLFSPIVAGFPVVALTTVLLLPARHALVWLVLLVSSLFVLAEITPPERWPDIPDSPWAFALEWGLMSVCAFLAGHALDRFRDKALSLADQRRIEAENQRDEALRVRRELERTATKLAQAKEQTEAALRTRTAFMANLSHELRTPLNGVIGTAQILESTSLDVQQSELVAALLGSGKSLNGLLSDVLDFAKLESQMMEIERIDFELEDPVRETCQTFQPVADGKGIELRSEIDERLPTRVVGDPNRIRQVLFNLVSNALKYTEQGEVVIRVRPEGAAVRFEVEDRGIGIPENRLLSLFDPFVQVDNSTARRFGGTGLGLSICRQLVGLMEGEIGVESQLGHGSLFWLDLPLATAAPQASSEGVAQEMATRSSPLRGTVLVAEDNPVNQLVMRSSLGRLGIEVKVVANGEDAIAAVADGGIDLVLMDNHMPGCDGVEATRRLRAGRAGRGLPIVAVTATVTPDARRLFLAAGANDFLSKPVDLAQLTRVLRAYLPANSEEPGDSGVALDKRAAS